MQIEGTKLKIIMNFGGLNFFKFASRMPQIAQILVLTFTIFRGKGVHAPGPPLEISSPFLISDSRFWETIESDSKRFGNIIKS